MGAAVTAWTCAWVLTEQRGRQGEEAVLRQTVALPLPSSPTMAAPYKGSSISRTCLHPPLRSNPKRFHRKSGIRKACETNQGLSCFCGERAKAPFSAGLLCALHLVEPLHITSVPARYPPI